MDQVETDFYRPFSTSNFVSLLPTKMSVSRMEEKRSVYLSKMEMREGELDVLNKILPKSLCLTHGLWVLS